MAILLTGGTGKTSSRIAQMCLNAKVPFVITSRKGQDAAPEGMEAIKFDWNDASTFNNPFNYHKIDAIYLVAPETANPVSEMGPFIDLAVEKGVQKFVYFTGSSAELGGPYVGQVWSKLDNTGVEYTVLRATWFMDNFLLWQHGATIKNENKFYSACGSGKIPFISANDIARTGFHCLTTSKPLNKAYRVLGPELLTFDQVAEKLSVVTGRKIEHIKVSEDESYDRFVNFGMPGHAAKFLSGIETGTANGAEEFTGNDVEVLTGKAPEKFETWSVDNKAGFM